MGTDSDNGFEQLDSASTEVIGPPAVLLCGFAADEAGQIGELLQEVGLAGHAISSCTTTMGNWTVDRALAGSDDGALLPAGEAPRIMLLSGVTDRQVELVLDGYPATGIPRPIFAVATPVNLGFTVIELLEDLIAEQMAMRSR